MTGVFEFIVFVQFDAEDEHEAAGKFEEFLADPTLDCYAIGTRSGRPPREVAEDDH